MINPLTITESGESLLRIAHNLNLILQSGFWYDDNYAEYVFDDESWIHIYRDRFVFSFGVTLTLQKRFDNMAFDTEHTNGVYFWEKFYD